MNIILDKYGGIELSRGVPIIRGQNKTSKITVGWKEGCEPVDTDLLVEINITRPDGEQSGWHPCIKVDGETKYYYILQAWDTIISGVASAVVRWYNCNEDASDEATEIYPSAPSSFIIENGVIAQPLPVSNENYANLMALLTPLQTNGLRKYNSRNLPSDIAFSINGEKAQPALYYNYANFVYNLLVSEDGTSYSEEAVKQNGFLLVSTAGKETYEEMCQTEVFFAENGKIYFRTIPYPYTAGNYQFRDITENHIKKNVETNQKIVSESNARKNADTTNSRALDTLKELLFQCIRIDSDGYLYLTGNGKLKIYEQGLRDNPKVDADGNIIDDNAWQGVRIKLADGEFKVTHKDGGGEIKVYKDSATMRYGSNRVEADEHSVSLARILERIAIELEEHQILITTDKDVDSLGIRIDRATGDIKITTKAGTYNGRIIFNGNDIELKLDNFESRLTRVEDVIPNQATKENQLADKNFVNSSIQTGTAGYCGRFDNWDKVPTEPSGYLIKPDINNYMVVQDATGYNAKCKGTWRFKYYGTWKENGKSGWAEEYQVNEEPLTAAQIEALNSGITAGMVDEMVEAENQRKANEIERQRAEQNRVADWANAEGIKQILIEDKDNNIKYGYKIELVNGKPRLVYEEV